MSGEEEPPSPSMAVTLEGFSIRAYATKMRTIDVVKSWPFTEITNDKEMINRLLPPITCRNYRWWSDEISKTIPQVENVLDKSMITCPVCQSFRAKKVNAMNAHVERCLVKAAKEERRKVRKEVAAARDERRKLRLPKKRSIGEIFDAAPSSEMEKRGGNCWIGKKTRKNKKPVKMKGNIGIFDYLTRLDTEKVNSNRFKVPSCDAIYGQLKGSLINKRLHKEMPVTKIKKKSSSMKSSFTPSKLKTIQGSKLVHKGHHFSDQRASISGNLKANEQTNVHQVSQSGSNVQFSGKDDILGPTQICSSVDLHQMQTLCKVFSDVMTLPSVRNMSIENNHHVAASDEAEQDGGCEEVLPSITGGSEAVSGHIGLHNRNCNSRENDFSDETFMAKHTLQHYSSLLLPNHGNFATKQDHLLVGIDNVAGTSGGAVQEAPTGRNLLAPFADSLPTSPGINTLANMMAASESLASLLTLNTEPHERHALHQKTTTHNSTGYSLQHKPPHDLLPKELASNICPSVKRKTKKASIHRNKAIYKDLIGLPLNSQGELIQYHSGSKEAYSQLSKQSIMMDSSRGFPSQNPINEKGNMDHQDTKKYNFVGLALTKDKLTLFPEENYCKECPGSYGISGLGPPEFLNTGRTEIRHRSSLRGNNQSDSQLCSDQNVINISSPQSTGNDQTRSYEKERIQSEESLKCRFPPPTQPMMQLIGEVVTVSRSVVQGFGDGHMCNDAKIIAGHHSTTISHNKYLNKRFVPEWIVHPVSQNSTGSMCTIDSQGACKSPGLLHMKAFDPRYAQSHLKLQRHVVAQNGIPMNKGNNNTRLHKSSNASPSQALLNEKLNFPNISYSGILSHMGSSPIPISAPTTCRSSQELLLNSSQPESNLILANGASSFQFPFLIQDYPEYGQQLQSRTLPKSLPQHMLNSTSKQNPVSSSQFYNNSNAKHYPCTISRGNLSTFLYPHLTSETSGPASLFPPGFQHISSVDMEDLDHTRETTERLAPKTNESTKPRPNLEMHEGLHSLMKSKERVISKAHGQYERLLESNAYRNKVWFTESSPNEIQKDVYQISSRISSSKVDTISRSGPTKLTAGAKHILKPSDQMDWDNSRPIHSTIPLRVGKNFEISGFPNKG